MDTINTIRTMFTKTELQTRLMNKQMCITDNIRFGYNADGKYIWLFVCEAELAGNGDFLGWRDSYPTSYGQESWNDAVLVILDSIYLPKLKGGNKNV